MAKINYLSREPALNQAEFIGRESEIRWFFDKLGRQSPENCNLIGEPRIGKTSLLYRIYEQQMGLPPNEKGLYVWVPLAELHKHDSLSFWRFLAKKVCKSQLKAGLLPEKTAVPRPDEAEIIFEALDECLEQLFEEVKLDRLVMIIDDFDLVVCDNGIEKRDLDWLRALATRYGRALAFVISSTDSLVTLADRLTGPSDVSPFPNLFHNLQLGLLDPSDAEKLCRQAAVGEQFEINKKDVAFLLAEAGRHPDLLKIACNHLFAEGREKSDDNYHQAAGFVRLDDRVGWLSRQFINRRTPEEKVILHQIIAGLPMTNTILLNHLQKVGLIELRNDKPVLFADAFQYWFQQKVESQPASRIEYVTPLLPFEHAPDERKVKMNGRVIELTRLENRLLIYLGEHVNQVCTNQELLQNVWGEGKKKAVVEKGINRLRKKIEQDPQRPRYILSARGEGYLLRVSEQPSS
jgi:hypothetical protein